MHLQQDNLCFTCRNYIKHPVYAGGQCCVDPMTVPQTYSCADHEPWKSERDRAIHIAFREACDDMARSRGVAPLDFNAEDISRIGRPTWPRDWTR